LAQVSARPFAFHQSAEPRAPAFSAVDAWLFVLPYFLFARAIPRGRTIFPEISLGVEQPNELTKRGSGVLNATFRKLKPA
jgi:hypothetical protein